MRSIKAPGWIAWGILLLAAPGAVLSPLTGSGIQSLATSVTVWHKYTVTAIANGANGCANANGCWQVNGVLGAIKAADVNQNITLFGLPANGAVNGYRFKTSTACTGTTTLTIGLGTASNTQLYAAGDSYDLQAAVSATNLTTTFPLLFGSDTASAVSGVVPMISTGSNIDQVTAGCSFDVHVLWAVLP